MPKRKNTLIRLTILLTISLVTFAGSCPPAIVRRTNFFSPFDGASCNRATHRSANGLANEWTVVL